MNKKNGVQAVVGVLALAGVAAGVLLIGQAADPWKLPASEMPPLGYPSDLGSMAGEGLLAWSYPPEEYDVGLEIEWYAIGRRLSFLWCAMPEGPSGTGLTQETDYSLPFWPTSFAASPSQAGDFYVAGWTERGRTRILKLHVSAPQVGLVQEPGGGSSFSLVPGAVTRTSEIYDADTNQVGFIGNLFENKANSTHLFLHEFPSGDLYDLDLPSGVRTLLASTTGSPQSQDLTGPYNGAVSMDHAVHGYSYVLTHTNYSLGESQRPNLVYFDVDRNGTLDSILSPSDSEYAQLDMLNPSATTGWD